MLPEALGPNKTKSYELRTGFSLYTILIILIHPEEALPSDSLVAKEQGPAISRKAGSKCTTSIVLLHL
jgi:hypothetical protein